MQAGASGSAVGDTGDIELAIAQFTSAIQSGDLIGPDLAIAYYERGNAYANLGDLARAIADYDEALRLDPELAGAYNNRGLA